MLRITKLIRRERIFDYLNNPKVAKVELNNGRNKGLKNPKLCKIYLYLDTQVKGSQDDSIQSILGACKKNEVDIPFIKGIRSQRALGWLSRTHVKKLKEIEVERGLNLSIPHYFWDLIEEFEDKPIAHEL